MPEKSGLIFTLKPTDFFAGAESTVVYENRNPSGNWEKYKPTDEWQRKLFNGQLGYDTFSCVTFSALRIVAMQLEYMIETDPASTSELVGWLKANGYIDENGKINFNEWFTANASKTSMNGNTAQAVWDSICSDGLLPQDAAYSVNDFNMTSGWLDPSLITKKQRDTAKKILDLIDIKYEWAVIAPAGGAWEDFRKHLKQAPLHIFTPVAATWNRTDGLPVESDGQTHLAHATSAIGIEAGNVYNDLDHYSPFIKRLAPNYYVPYAMKAVVSLKSAVQKPNKPTHVFNTNLAYNDPIGPEVHALQEALQYLGYMKQGLFGIYGPATRAALATFQKHCGVIDPNPGEHFGPLTRSFMNAALAT